MVTKKKTPAKKATKKAPARRKRAPSLAPMPTGYTAPDGMTVRFIPYNAPPEVQALVASLFGVPMPSAPEPTTAAPSVSPLKIEWHSETKAWRASFASSGDDYLEADTPCGVASSVMDQVRVAFELLGRYGTPAVELINIPPIRDAIHALGAEINNAHAAAHIAADALEKATKENRAN